MTMKMITKMMKAKFLHHEPCPNCGSRNNLARYSDGHAFCFGCSYREAATIIDSPLLRLVDKSKSNDMVTLPEDATSALHPQAIEWLNKYDITLAERNKAKLLWSDKKQALIFPFYSEDNSLLFWSGRIFGEKTKFHKYFTRGNVKDCLTIYEYKSGVYDTSVCLVEDALSALKVSRVVDALPLFGCIIAPYLLNRLKLVYTNVYIWLDPDKQSTYGKSIGLAKLLFDNVKYIRSKADPKEFSTEEIEHFIIEDK